MHFFGKYIGVVNQQGMLSASSANMLTAIFVVGVVHKCYSSATQKCLSLAPYKGAGQTGPLQPIAKRMVGLSM
jgi:hypothetical protein